MHHNQERGHNLERKIIRPAAPQAGRLTTDAATNTIYFMMVVSGWSIPCAAMLGVACRVFLWVAGLGD
jgi:hypothetical protein